MAARVEHGSHLPAEQGPGHLQQQLQAAHAPCGINTAPSRQLSSSCSQPVGTAWQVQMQIQSMLWPLLAGAMEQRPHLQKPCLTQAVRQLIL